MSNEKSLKDLVFKGAFFVILVYLLVYAYNSGILSRFRKTAIKNTAPMVTSVDKVTPLESSPSDEFTQ